jgi:Mg-chelatase subunit ChlD
MKKPVGTFLFLSLALVSLTFNSFGQQKRISDTSKATDNRDTLEMVFVLDTTGSMGGLIDGAKQRIWGIINEVMQKPSKPRVRVGLVAYRDNGDEYVTKLLAITEDLDKVYTTLMDYRADGGGDTPENVRKALAEGVRNAGWTKSRNGLAQMHRPKHISRNRMFLSRPPKPFART